MPDFKKLSALVGKHFGGEKKYTLIVLLGILGMALILLSQFWGDGGAGRETEAGEENAGTVLYTSEEYAAALEEKLHDMITGMEGVGRARIMVTLENSGEYVYLQEEKRNVDRTVEPGEEGTSDRVSTKENVEQSYILVDAGYGQRQALVRTHLEPKIQGVVIVCEGADDVRVQQRLINVVTTALNISSTRVCVEKIS